MISDYRLMVIQKKVDELQKLLNIQEYPIKMSKLIKQHYPDKIIFAQLSFHTGTDIVSNYDPVHGITVMTINKRRMLPNLYKRLNFTLAHELGHIALGHYLPYQSSRRLRIASIEEEADEFAGLFLVPEKDFLKHAFDLDMLSDHFYVTKDMLRIRNIRYNTEKLKRERLEADEELMKRLDRYKCGI